MKIAVLAWGSLVWSRQDLKFVGDFEPIGPRIPIKFCCASGSASLSVAIESAADKKRVENTQQIRSDFVILAQRPFLRRLSPNHEVFSEC
jgi:hypothetical protein